GSLVTVRCSGVHAGTVGLGGSSPGSVGAAGARGSHGDIGSSPDAFGDAQEITGESGELCGANVGSTKEVGEPSHAGYAGGASVWFSWVAPRDGLARIDTITSAFDTLLAVYTGSSVGALTPVASDDNSGGNGASVVTLPVTAGTRYAIATDGMEGATGGFALRWEILRAPKVTIERPDAGVWLLDTEAVADAPMSIVVGTVSVDARVIKGSAAVCAMTFFVDGAAAEPSDVSNPAPDLYRLRYRSVTPGEHEVLARVSDCDGLVDSDSRTLFSVPGP
ncbi:MAG TPA: hypothetical protein VM600_06580, partial [Actinomycetota bacterium]|nr:hypothetical protein [Actinomycetota bacterium]